MPVTPSVPLTQDAPKPPRTLPGPQDYLGGLYGTRGPGLHGDPLGAQSPTGCKERHGGVSVQLTMARGSRAVPSVSLSHTPAEPTQRAQGSHGAKDPLWG